MPAHIYDSRRHFAKSTETALRLKSHQSPIDAESLKKITEATTAKPLIQPGDLITQFDTMSLAELAKSDAAKGGGTFTQAHIDNAKKLQTEIDKIQTAHTAATAQLAEEMQKAIELQLRASNPKNLPQSIEIKKRIVDTVTNDYKDQFTDLNKKYSDEIKKQIANYDDILDKQKTANNQEESAQACNTAIIEALQKAKEQALNGLLKDESKHIREASAHDLIHHGDATAKSSTPSRNSVSGGAPTPAKEIETGKRIKTDNGALITTNKNGTSCKFATKKGLFGHTVIISEDDIYKQLLHNKAISDKPDITITINVGTPDSKPNQAIAQTMARAYYKAARKLGYTDDQINFRSDRHGLDFSGQEYKEPSRWGKFKDHFRTSFDEQMNRHEKLEQQDLQRVLDDIGQNIYPIIKAGQQLAMNTNRLRTDVDDPNIDTKKLIEDTEALSEEINQQLKAIELLAEQPHTGRDRATALQEELNTTYDALETTKDSIEKAKQDPNADAQKIAKLEESYKTQKDKVGEMGESLFNHHKKTELLAYQNNTTPENSDAPRAHTIRRD